MAFWPWLVYLSFQLNIRAEKSTWYNRIFNHLCILFRLVCRTEFTDWSWIAHYKEWFLGQASMASCGKRNSKARHRYLERKWNNINWMQGAFFCIPSILNYTSRPVPLSARFCPRFVHIQCQLLPCWHRFFNLNVVSLQPLTANIKIMLDNFFLSGLYLPYATPVCQSCKWLSTGMQK